MITRTATVQDVPQIAEMVGELLAEIMAAIGERAFNFDLAVTIERLGAFLSQEKYFVFVAFDGDRPAGFVALYESYALYAEGPSARSPSSMFARPIAPRHWACNCFPRQRLSAVRAVGSGWR